jgi:hypothetical protein
VSQQIGFFREITPCPSSGKITFKQIGAIRQITTNITCDNEELLLARKPQPTGELDSFNNPIYALREPTYDPSDYYSAYWGASYDVIKGDDLGPTPLGDWNEQFEDPQPPDDFKEAAENAGGNAQYVNGSRSVGSVSNGEVPHIEVRSTSGGVYSFFGYQGTNVIYRWNYYPRTAYAISYLSRAKAGDRLVFYFEWKAGNSNWYDVGCSMRIIGWRDGWMGNDLKEYASIENSSNQWASEIVEIEVDPSYRDIAIAFYQTGSENGNYQQVCSFRNVHCWRA